MGLEHILNINALEGSSVVAIADPNEPSLDMVAGFAPDARRFSNHEDLLDWGHFDIAVVVTPNHTHHRILLDLIAADVHFLTEKPMCITVDEALDVLRAARGSTKVQWMGLEYRYMPPIGRLLAELAKDPIGAVRMIAMREHRVPFLQKVGHWNRFEKTSGGTLVEKCCHFFDLMNLVAGARPVRVLASGAQDVNHLDESYDGAVPDMIDNAYVIVEYANGVRAMLDLSMFGEGSTWEQELVVTGSSGKLEAYIPAWYDGRPGMVRFCTRRDGIYLESEVEDDRIQAMGHHHGASYLEHLDMRTAVLTGSPPLVTLEDGLWSVAVGQAAHRSIDEGRSVEIAELLTEEAVAAG